MLRVSMVRMERRRHDSGFQSESDPAQRDPSTRLRFAGTTPPTPQLPHCRRSAAEGREKGAGLKVTVGAMSLQWRKECGSWCRQGWPVCVCICVCVATPLQALRSLTHTHSLSHTQSLSHTHSLTHTNTLSHTHTHTLSPISLKLAGFLSFHVFVCLCVCVCVWTYLSVCLSVCLSDCLSCFYSISVNGSRPTEHSGLSRWPETETREAVVRQLRVQCPPLILKNNLRFSHLHLVAKEFCKWLLGKLPFILI